MKISDNTIKIGRKAGYYNRKDAFVFRASTMLDPYIPYDGDKAAADRYSRYCKLVNRALENNGINDVCIF